MRSVVCNAATRLFVGAGLLLGSASALVVTHPAFGQDRDRDQTQDCTRLPDGTCDQTPDKDRLRDQDKLKDPDADQDRDRDRLHDSDVEQQMDRLHDRTGGPGAPSATGSGAGSNRNGSGSHGR